MRPLHWTEVDKLVEFLQPLSGAQLQEVTIRRVHLPPLNPGTANPVAGKPGRGTKSSVLVLGLGFYLERRVQWLLVWADPLLPFLTLADDLPGQKAHKSLQPIELFMRSHTLGRRVIALRRDVNRGRVVALEMSGCLIRIVVIPHRADVWVSTEDKGVSWLRREMPEPAQEQGSDLEAQSANVGRSLDELMSEFSLRWAASSSLASAGKGADQAGSQHRLQKLLRAVEAMRLDLEAKRRNTWEKRAVGLQQILYTLDGRRPLRMQEPECLVELAREIGEQPDAKPWWDLRPAAALEEAFSRHKDTQRRILEAERRLTQLEVDIENLRKVDSESEPLSELGVSHPHSGAEQRPGQSEHRRLRLADDLDCVVGKSAHDNLALLRAARPHDIWLHLRGHPGAHGFIHRAKGRSVSDHELAEAARFVIEHTLKKRSRELIGQRFEVSIAECRYIRPIKGDRVGRVHVLKERVINVRIS